MHVSPTNLDDDLSIAHAPLAYQQPAHEPWLPMVRLVSLAAAGQGFAIVLDFTAQLSQYLASVHNALVLMQQPATFIEMIIVAINAGVLATGLSALRHQPAGRRGLLGFEFAHIAFCVLRSIYSLWQFWFHFRVWRFSSTLSTAASLLGTLVLPMLIWHFFRRPEVRAVFDG